MFALIYFTRHPERSEAESNFFVPDPKRRCAPFAPHCVRSSTALRMTQTKKAPREAKRDLQRSSAHCALSHHNINRHSIAFSFDTRGAKEKASQKENAVFLCRFLKKALQKLFIWVCANIVRWLIIKLIFILSLFLLTQEAQKKKLRKKKTLFFRGRCPS